MSTTILLILLFAAICHAIWNALSKRIEERDAFFTLILGASVILYLPLAIYLWRTSSFPVSAIKWLLLSTISEVMYFVALAKAYQTNNLSYAYPILRGTAPIVTTIISTLFIGAAIAWTGYLGILIIVAGVVFMNQRSFSFGELSHLLKDWHNMKWVFMAGSCSALSSVLDGMGASMMSGLLFKYVVFIGMFAGKWILDRRAQAGVSYFSLLKRHPWHTLAGGLFVFVSNSLAVYAMQTTPVTYVASVREISIVFATVIGVFWLKESVSLVKWVSIGLILTGVIVIKMS
ncbi:DMT family transporter [Brevibacillus choshinensis]|uniref:EamA family transporter n=1 Tax=Brevibacillus choshinensis TaxID=54911 RepID=A0ABX7FK39_BRECH|nr:DMT family transporter [Brevibacillus choshinensis]QRG66586.1 EamA family transporter [Brevibacillus choshinensis]